MRRCIGAAAEARAQFHATLAGLAGSCRAFEAFKAGHERHMQPLRRAVLRRRQRKANGATLLPCQVQIFGHGRWVR